jgi:hypothetical protein
MGFMASIKQFFGIGGISVDVQCQPQVPKNAGFLQGAVTLNSKSDQHVLTLDVMLVEEFTTGRGEDKETKEFELGKVRLGGAFDMKAGQQQVINFQLPFQILKSNADELQEHGGALGALGSVAKFANAEKSQYFVKAECDVKGTALDPSGKQSVMLL